MSVDSPRRLPIVCTLDTDAVGDRVREWRDLVTEASGVRPVEGGIQLRFRADRPLATRIGALAAAEQSCCSFFEFTIRIAAGETELTVLAPPEAAAMIDELLGLDPVPPPA